MEMGNLSSAFAAPAMKEIAGTMYKYSVRKNGGRQLCSLLAGKKQCMMVSTTTNVTTTLQLNFDKIHLHDDFYTGCNTVQCNLVQSL